MPCRRAFAASLVLAALIGLVGCGRAEGVSSYPTFDPAAEDARQRTQADAALVRWSGLLDASPSGFFLLGSIGVGYVGEWEGGNKKAAAEFGHLVASGPIEGPAPANAVLRWADGTTAPLKALSAAQTLPLVAGDPSCRGCPSRVVTRAELTTATIATSKGVATVPAWEFTLEATAGRVVRAAVSLDDFTTMPEPPWDSSNPPAGLGIDSAVLDPDGRTLTAHFVGARGPASQPCGIDYTAVPVESDRAVVVMIFSRYHDSSESCTLAGFARTAKAELATPLGQRTVLESRTGQPVPVTTAS